MSPGHYLQPSLTTTYNTFRMEPCYKQHAAVDDLCGVIVDVDVTTGEQSAGSQLAEQIERIESNTGKKLDTLSADSAYAHGKNFEFLKAKDIDGIIPTQNKNSNVYRFDVSNMIRK